MSWTHSPYAQIALICLRSLNIHNARWLYFTLTCIAVITFVGGGIAMDWGAVEFAKAAFGAIAFSLLFAWIWISAAVMKLNQPTASRLVPGYVRPLRRTALAVWLGICILTGVAGMLNGIWLEVFLWQMGGAGAVMLWLSTPARWPVQWCLCFVALWWLSRNAIDIFYSEPFIELLKNKDVRIASVIAVFVSMACIVPLMIANRGTAFAAGFSRFLSIQMGDNLDPKSFSLRSDLFGRWIGTYDRVSHGMTFAWRRYADRLVSCTDHDPKQVLARAELGFGPGAHWVTQISLNIGLAVVVVLGLWMFGALRGTEGASISAPTALLLAMLGTCCAAFSVLLLPTDMLATRVEQKLMLLLPGMPRGETLNRTLAARHLRLAFTSWAIGAAWALALPFPTKWVTLLAAFFWGVLPLVALVVRDWSTLRPPNELRAIASLVLFMLGPAIAAIALLWLRLPMWLVAQVSMGTCLLLLWLRWNKMARFLPAFPAGQRALE